MSILLQVFLSHKNTLADDLTRTVRVTGYVKGECWMRGAGPDGFAENSTYQGVYEGC